MIDKQLERIAIILSLFLCLFLVSCKESNVINEPKDLNITLIVDNNTDSNTPVFKRVDEPTMALSMQEYDNKSFTFFHLYLSKNFTSQFENNFSKEEKRIYTYGLFLGMNMKRNKLPMMAFEYEYNSTGHLYKFNKTYNGLDDFTGEDDCFNYSNTKNNVTVCWIKYG